jgi:hypothetical protein
MYAIELSEIGRDAYSKRDVHLERAVLFLINKVGADAWVTRKRRIVERVLANLKPRAPTPVEGISIRDRDDEVGWYLHLAEQAIADPPSVDSDQAARIIPYLSTLGRKLDALQRIDGIDRRIQHFLRNEAGRDPDQAIFELLVGASYADEGWDVLAVQETGGRRTPDFQIDRPGQRFLVECKRLTRRPEYTERERDAWLRLWRPASDWLVANRVSLIWTVLLHEEIHTYPADFLVGVVRDYVSAQRMDPTVRNDECCSIGVDRADYDAIAAGLRKNYVKRNSSRERQLITGRHEPDYGLSYAIKGDSRTMGPEAAGSNEYWDAIHYVSAAYWRCDAKNAVSAKARDVTKRLAEATEQLSDSVPGIVHIGIETADGDDVELVRSEKILHSLQTFDPRGKRLAWIFLHFFRGESPPEELWAIDETTQWFGGPQRLRPLQALLLLGDDGVPTSQRAHWQAPRGAPPDFT